jgi:hypothetical protein
MAKPPASWVDAFVISDLLGRRFSFHPLEHAISQSVDVQISQSASKSV